MDFEAIKAAAQGYQADMTRFLREMISHPSESCEEKEVVHCIKAEMEKLGYQREFAWEESSEAVFQRVERYKKWIG